MDMCTGLCDRTESTVETGLNLQSMSLTGKAFENIMEKENVLVSFEPHLNLSSAKFNVLDLEKEFSLYLTLSQTTNFTLLQTERVCRRQF